MKQLFIILLFFISTAQIGLTQKAMQIKYEVGLEKSFYSFENPQNNISVYNNRQAYLGVTISHLLKNNFHVEAGIYSKYYAMDLFSTQPDTNNLIFAFNRLQVPLRILYKNSLFTNKLMYSLNTGASLMIAHSYNGIISYNNLEMKSGKTPPAFAIWETSAGLEYELSKNFTLGLNYRLYFGYKKQFDYHIQEKRSNNTTTDYIINSKGNFNSFTLSFGFKFKKIK